MDLLFSVYLIPFFCVGIGYVFCGGVTTDAVGTPLVLLGGAAIAWAATFRVARREWNRWTIGPLIAVLAGVIGGVSICVFGARAVYETLQPVKETLGR